MKALVQPKIEEVQNLRPPEVRPDITCGECGTMAPHGTTTCYVCGVSWGDAKKYHCQMCKDEHRIFITANGANVWVDCLACVG